MRAAAVMKLLAVLVGCSVCLTATAADAAITAMDRHQFFGHSSHKRSLLQDALGNSNGCLATIPKCEPGACATRNIMGAARWVCLRCLSNYMPVVDTSGQDNIIQCVCPAGTYEVAPNATGCTRCDINSYCPGGDKVENPASRGTQKQCGASMVTRTNGARSAVDCVAQAGYAMTSPTAATACPVSTYAPQYNRLVKCLRCQSGLEESPLMNLTDGQRDSKKTVCKVPPGKYVSQGLVRMCPQGFYRENYTDPINAVAQLCLPCNPGITTAGAGAKSPAECNRVTAGYGIQNVLNVTGPQSFPTLPQYDQGLPAATMCGIGFYGSGVFCAQCPSGTVTTSLGAKAIEECVVPPGYVIRSGNMTQCVSGEFREGWLMYSDPKALNCTPCGVGIASVPRDPDQRPGAATGDLVRATSTSCYIEAGQGMIAQGKNAFIAMDCPVNTYGAAGIVYGWAPAPCKPCPRNMITDNKTKVSDADMCVNPDGFGYASEGASRCAPGFYAAKGSRKACKRCPDGRTTFDDPALQRYESDCVVAPGNGVVVNFNSAVAGDIFAAAPIVNGLNATQILGLTVLQCPTGYYGGGEQLGATCAKCPDSSTTEGPGAIDLSQCNVCVAGFGKVNSNAPCTPCDYGTWQPGGFATCFDCDNSTFYAPVDGIGPSWTAVGTTMAQGSVGADACLPRQSQLSPEAGQAFWGPSLAPTLSGILSYVTRADSSPLGSMEECIGQCTDLSFDSCCFVQWDAAAQQCSLATLLPARPDAIGPVLYYKLPPSGLTAVSSVKQALAGGSKVTTGSSKATTGSSSSSSSKATAAGVVRAMADRGGPSRKAQPAAARMLRFTVSSSRKIIATPIGSAAVASSSGGIAMAASSSSGGRMKAKTLASGTYAGCIISPQGVSDWLRVGTPLGPDARTFSTRDLVWYNTTSKITCASMCDNSNVCWGFIFDDKLSRCLFRGGEDALQTRSFFQLADPRMATYLGTVMDVYNFAVSAPGLTTLGVPFEVLRAFGNAVMTLVINRNIVPDLTQVVLDAYSPWPAGPPVNGTVIADTVILSFQMSDTLKAYEAQFAAFFNAPSFTAALAQAMFLEATIGTDPLALTTWFYGNPVTLASAQVTIDLQAIQLGAAIPVDGCLLVAGYCGSNGNNTCQASVCGCQGGYYGNRCELAAGSGRR